MNSNTMYDAYVRFPTQTCIVTKCKFYILTFDLHMDLVWQSATFRVFRLTDVNSGLVMTYDVKLKPAALRRLRVIDRLLLSTGSFTIELVLRLWVSSCYTR